MSNLKCNCSKFSISLDFFIEKSEQIFSRLPLLLGTRIEPCFKREADDDAGKTSKKAGRRRPPWNLGRSGGTLGKHVAYAIPGSGPFLDHGDNWYRFRALQPQVKAQVRPRA